jgi:hypothetical protein
VRRGFPVRMLCWVIDLCEAVVGIDEGESQAVAKVKREKDKDSKQDLDGLDG